MSYASVEDFELLSFFEVLPKPADPDTPWPYNDFLYQVQLGTYLVSCSIHPAYKDLSLSICNDGTEIYRFSALSLNDIRYHKDADRETLEMVISDRESILLRLRPSVFIGQEVAGET